MIKATAKILITFYRITLSPFLPPSCRFHPTCSVYAHNAFSTKTPLTALYLTLRRLFRCHPFSDGGYDPVPTTTDNKAKVKVHTSPVKEVF